MGCYWIGPEAELLKATSPFDPKQDIVGCPKCKEVDALVEVCDVPGCERQATNGWPSAQGYRRTCERHNRFIPLP